MLSQHSQAIGTTYLPTHTHTQQDEFLRFDLFTVKIKRQRQRLREIDLDR